MRFGEFTVESPGVEHRNRREQKQQARSIELPSAQVDDEITLPNGCSIYAFLISGWSDNEDYDQIIFYKLAEFVAQNNGYFHVGWWNNLGRSTWRRPLHQQVIKVTKKVLFIPILEDNVFASPNSLQFPEAFLDVGVDLPKGNPDQTSSS